MAGARTRRLMMLVVGVAAAALTGCIDMVQYLSVNDRGEPTVYFRLTLQKGVFEMAGAMGGEASQGVESTLDDEFDLDREEVLSRFPAALGAVYEKVDTELEYGFALSYTLGAAAERELAAAGRAAPFVPIRSDAAMTILFPHEGSGEQGEGAEGEQFAKLFLSSAKYRVMVSKRLAPRLRSATFVTPDGEIALEVVDLPEIYLVEVPVVHWLTAEEACLLELR